MLMWRLPSPFQKPEIEIVLQDSSWASIFFMLKTIELIKNKQAPFELKNVYLPNDLKQSHQELAQSKAQPLEWIEYQKFLDFFFWARPEDLINLAHFQAANAAWLNPVKLDAFQASNVCFLNEAEQFKMQTGTPFLHSNTEDLFDKIKEQIQYQKWLTSAYDPQKTLEIAKLSPFLGPNFQSRNIPQSAEKNKNLIAMLPYLSPEASLKKQVLEVICKELAEKACFSEPTQASKFRFQVGQKNRKTPLVRWSLGQELKLMKPLSFFRSNRKNLHYYEFTAPIDLTITESSENLLSLMPQVIFGRQTWPRFDEYPELKVPKPKIWSFQIEILPKNVPRPASPSALKKNLAWIQLQIPLNSKTPHEEVLDFYWTEVRRQTQNVLPGGILGQMPQTFVVKPCIFENTHKSKPHVQICQSQKTFKNFALFLQKHLPLENSIESFYAAEKAAQNLAAVMTPKPLFGPKYTLPLGDL